MALRSTLLVTAVLAGLAGFAPGAVAPPGTWQDCDGEQGAVARTAVPAGTLSGHLEQGAPHAYEWSLRLQAGDMLAALLAMRNPLVQGRLALLDLGCNVLCASEPLVAAATFQHLRCVAPADATYLLRVSAVGGGGDFTVAYALTP